MKKFVAMYVQTSDTSDNKPYALGIFNNREDALEEVRADMMEWYKNLHYSNDVSGHIDIRNMFVNVGGCQCQWNISEVEM